MRTVIRATAVLIENGKILLLQEKVTNKRAWSLPGGKLEIGESLEDCLIREMQEETGLDVEVGPLLFIGERMMEHLHVVHISFEVTRKIQDSTANQLTENILDSPTIKLAPLKDLEMYGFSSKFKELAINNFPAAGSYVGAIENIGL